jgi:hypothetical protein
MAVVPSKAKRADRTLSERFEAGFIPCAPKESVSGGAVISILRQASSRLDYF